MIADDVVHESVGWQVHWKNGQWRHVSVKEHDSLFWLHSVLETICAGQVKVLVLVGDLVEWIELGAE